MTCCINGRNFIKLLFLSTKLFKFDILCAHKCYFLMLGHIYNANCSKKCAHMHEHYDYAYLTVVFESSLKSSCFI